jgi:CheY-like chemotaxis protein
VLVVDDEGTVRMACERSLEEHGIEVDAVDRGEDAIPRIGSMDYDAVLLDLMMPGVGGIATLDEIRLRWPDLPVVVITGYATLDVKRDCLARGASAWVAKPFGPDEIIDALRSVVPDMEGCS